MRPLAYAIAVALVAVIAWYLLSRPKEGWEINPCDWVNQISSGVNKDILSPINDALDKMPTPIKQRVLGNVTKNVYACPSGTIPEGDKCRKPCPDGSVYTLSDKMCTTTTYPDDYIALKAELTNANTTLSQATTQLQATQSTLQSQQATLNQLTQSLTSTSSQIQVIESELTNRLNLLSQITAIPTDDQIRQANQQAIDQVPIDANAAIQQARAQAQQAIDYATQFCKEDPSWKTQQAQLNQQITYVQQQIQLIQPNLTLDIQQITTKAQQTIDTLKQTQQDKISEQNTIIATAQANIKTLQQQITAQNATISSLVASSADSATIQAAIDTRNSLQKQIDSASLTIQQAQQSIQTVNTYTTNQIAKITQDRDDQIQTLNTVAQIQPLQTQLTQLQTQVAQPYSPECTAQLNQITAQQNEQVAQITNDVNTSAAARLQQLKTAVPGQLQAAAEQRATLQMMLNQQDQAFLSSGINPTMLQSQLQSLRIAETVTQQQIVATQTQINGTQTLIEAQQTRVSLLQTQVNTIQDKITNYTGAPTITTKPPTYVSPQLVSSNVDISISMIPTDIVKKCDIEVSDLKRQDSIGFCSTPGYSYTQGACYPACPDGYKRFGTECKQTCADGYTQNGAGDCFAISDQKIPASCPSGMYQSTDAGNASICARKGLLWRDIPGPGAWQCAKDETYDACYRKTPVAYSYGLKGAGCNGPQKKPVYWFGDKNLGVMGYNDCYQSGGNCVAGCQYEAHVPFSDKWLADVGTCPSNFPYKGNAYCYKHPYKGDSYTPDTKASPGDLKYGQKCPDGYHLVGAEGAQWCTEDCPGGTAVDFGAFASCFKVPKF